MFTSNFLIHLIFKYISLQQDNLKALHINTARVAGQLIYREKTKQKGKTQNMENKACLIQKTVFLIFVFEFLSSYSIKNWKFLSLPHKNTRALCWGEEKTYETHFHNRCGKFRTFSFQANIFWNLRKFQEFIWLPLKRTSYGCIRA